MLRFYSGSDRETLSIGKILVAVIGKRCQLLRFYSGSDRETLSIAKILQWQ